MNGGVSRTEACQVVAGRWPAAHWRRRLGQLLIDACGISRSGPRLSEALAELEALRQQCEAELRVSDHDGTAQAELSQALRLQDFLALGDLMLRDALAREESCGAHFREEYQTAEGEARRDDQRFAHIAAWEHRPEGPPQRHQEPLAFTLLQPSRRDYR